MEMAAHLRQPAHRVDHARRDVTRVWAREPDAAQAVDLVQTLEQSREIAGRIVGGLVMVHDLAEELYLPGARIRGLPCLRDNVGRLPHSFMSPGVRHDAERAELIAAFDDGDVRLERIV